MHESDILLGQKIDKLTERLESFEKIMEPIVEITPKLKGIVEAYDSVIFGKKFLTGVAIVISSIAAIGGAFYAFVSWIRHG